MTILGEQTRKATLYTLISSGSMIGLPRGFLVRFATGNPDKSKFGDAEDCEPLHLSESLIHRESAKTIAPFEGYPVSVVLYTSEGCIIATGTASGRKSNSRGHGEWMNNIPNSVSMSDVNPEPSNATLVIFRSSVSK